MDIQGYLKKAEYLWRPTIKGKHIESAYFAYFSREFGCKTILCMRKMKDGQKYKPYAIIDQYTFNASIYGQVSVHYSTVKENDIVSYAVKLGFCYKDEYVFVRQLWQGAPYLSQKSYIRRI